MSEYWKSTPKYWCKHCKVYVRDTKLEKANHDATPRHQGNLKRFLKDLHRGHEKDEKDKERAKAEVARLNGMVAGGSGPVAGSSSSGFGRGSTPSLPKPQATPAQRKQQLAQLAEMGVSIPNEFRPDMAMAGEWQVTAERVLDQYGEEKKPDALALGVRKRAVEEEEEEAAEAKKRRWGTAIRTHPGEEDDGDLDALLSAGIREGNGSATKTEVKEEAKQEIKEQPESKALPGDEAGSIPPNDDLRKQPGIKREPSDDETALETGVPTLDLGVKQEGEEQSMAGTGVIFKKRKAKNIRQK